MSFFDLLFIYPTLFCLASLRPYESGNVNLVTMPSGPNTFNGILSNDSDSERESDCSCRLETFLFSCFIYTLIQKIKKKNKQKQKLTKIHT